MDQLKRWTRNLLSILAFGASAFLVLILFATITFSAYSGWYVIHNVDRGIDEIVRSAALLNGAAARLDSHAEFLTRKASQIERKMPLPTVTVHAPGGSTGKKGG